MKKLILIIDDDSSLRLLLKAYFKKYFNIVIKADGLEGMVWLNEGNIPDLIIADMDMPRLNGYEFIRSIRQSGFYKDIPLIVVTGWDNSEVRKKCMEVGADEFITKPFNPLQLMEKIDHLLNKHKIYSYAS